MLYISIFYPHQCFVSNEIILLDIIKKKKELTQIDNTLLLAIKSNGPV